MQNLRLLFHLSHSATTKTFDTGPVEFLTGGKGYRWDLGVRWTDMHLGWTQVLKCDSLEAWDTPVLQTVRLHAK